MSNVTSRSAVRVKVDVRALRRMKEQGCPAAWVTAYDFPIASAAERAGVDMILVGDSGGMTQLGYATTNPVTMEEMLVLARAARRGAADTFLIGDMPQGSYEVDNRTAVLNALRFVKEAGCDAVKLEGGTRVAGRVRAIAEAGILVMGHLGLTPQSAATFGGYRVQGRTPDVFEQILNDAHRLAEAGAFALLLEAMPSESAGQVARQVDFPVYGIGAGGEVDGQLVVVHDLLGMFRPFRPSFCRCYVPDVVERFQRHLVALGSSPEPPPPGKDGLLELIEMAIAAYVRDVRHGAFPSAEHCYPLAKGELERLEASSHWVRRLERART